MICALAVAVLAANLWQPYPEIAPLQHIPTVALLLASPWLLRRWPLSAGSAAAIVGFFLLHTLAGRYAYSNLPYDAWGRALTGQSIDAAFGWSRNNFDRLVHLSFGIFAVPPVVEIARRYAGAGPRLGLWTGFLFVSGVSAVYEVFEWLLSVLLSPGMADEYNGQQGDMWDAQKDMAIAIFGACCSIGWVARRGRAAN
jgi:putative membrane protein